MSTAVERSGLGLLARKNGARVATPVGSKNVSHEGIRVYAASRQYKTLLFHPTEHIRFWAPSRLLSRRCVGENQGV
jgi:hypothetical protein